jgi:predicted GNAT family acetyltransferase
MFVIVVGESAVGSVGYWPREWNGEDVYETGWGVLPEHRGHGVARKAAAMVIDIARQDGSCTAIHAFPSPNNLSSNAICRANGFILLGEATVEYPPGHQMRVNDWRLSLTRTATIIRRSDSDPYAGLCSRRLLQLATVDLSLRRYDTDGRRSDEHRAARKPALSVQRKRRDCPARTTLPPRDLQR